MYAEWLRSNINIRVYQHVKNDGLKKKWVKAYFWKKRCSRERMKTCAKIVSREKKIVTSNLERVMVLKDMVWILELRLGRGQGKAWSNRSCA